MYAQSMEDNSTGTPAITPNTFDTERTWNDLIESAKVAISKTYIDAWFRTSHLVRIHDHEGRFVAEIGCNSTFTKNTLEQKYYPFIQDHLEKTLGNPVDLLFVIKQKPQHGAPKTITPAPLFETIENNQEALREAVVKAGIRATYTFANYAVSSSNQMAHAAAEAVAGDPGRAYNPLFIYGGVGVGKTHLMHAVGRAMLEKDTNIGIVSGTGEQFTNDIVEGIRNKNTLTVRNKYRKLTALLLDDIQFIAGKDTVQEEFFHTFNALVSANAQVILTSDRPPSEIPKLEDRLRSRFEAGLIVDIGQPDFELRCAIVQIKAKEKGIDLDPDLVQLIAGNIDSARQLEGFLIKLITEAKFKKLAVTKDLIESLLGKGEDMTELRSKVTPNDMINAVSKYFAVGKRALLGDSRVKTIAQPRQILMYLLRTQLSLPLDEVGRLVGRDHTTVMHAVDKITNLASVDVNIRESLMGIKKQV